VLRRPAMNKQAIDNNNLTDLFGNRVISSPLVKQSLLIQGGYRSATFSGRDLYTTRPSDIVRFLDMIHKNGIHLASPIWEPAAGLGDISKTLIKYGYEVKSTDIYPYKDEEIEIEAKDFFLNKDSYGCKTIFTNPPFNACEEFLMHAFSLNVDIVFFVRNSFLSSTRRFKIFQRFNPLYCCIYSKRAQCFNNGVVTKGNGIVDYCVLIWKPPYKNETFLRWIE
jgi:hypothetical protein